MRSDNSHRRTPTILATLAVLALVAAGCATTTNAPSPAPTTAPPSGTNFPVTIQNCGRTLTFDKPPTRVITFTSGLDTMITLGVQNKVIGHTGLPENLDDLPPGWKAAYQTIPAVSEGSRLPPKEPLLASGADLVIGSYYTDFDASSGHATRDELAAAGTNTFIVGHNCTTQDIKAYTFQVTYDDVRDFGAIFGVPERAEQVIHGLQARVAEVTKRVANLKPLRVVTTDATDEAFYAPDGGTYAEVVNHAGGTNVFNGNKDLYPQINLEEVANANAQAYVIINYLPGTAEQRIARIQAAAPDSEGVRKRRYAVVDDSELWVGIRIVDGLDKVARVLHPEAFQ